MKTRSIVLGWMGAALALPLVGCPGGVCPAVRFEDPATAIASYQQSREPLRVMRAEARVDRRDEEGRIRGTVMMFLERPDRVRFDAMTQMGPAAILTSDGTTFELTDLREDRFYVGPTCPSNIERLLGIPLAGDEVALLLTGQTPRIEATRSEMRCDGGTYHVTLHGSDGRTQTLALEVRPEDREQPPDQQQMRLRESRVNAANGALEWRVSWDDYRAVQDPSGGAAVTMPFRIQFEQPSRGIDTLVRFESIDLNAEVPADAFVQEARPGLQVETVQCE
ncbi:LolA family protein [Sandaracinus amylolyticus]|uniref:LolA family protein n=1 Tax=Sandaracinus amylolyticus TaxID=927083 RepID=UPI001F2A168B|nr:DUF4292 domain-containing protein [Sandaracinus amylolyticus]